MTDSDDRLIEYALREVHTMKRDEPDLAGTVRAAWEEGVIRAAPRLEHRRRVRESRPARSHTQSARRADGRERSVSRPLALTAAVVAAVVITGTLAFLRFQGDAGGDANTNPEPASTFVATADRPIIAIDRASRVSGLSVDEAALIPPGEPVRLSLPGGATVLAEPKAKLSFVGDDEESGKRGSNLQLARGAIRVDAGDDAIAVFLPAGGRAKIPAGASAWLRYDGAVVDIPRGLVEIQATRGDVAFVFESPEGDERALHDAIEGRARAGEPVSRVLLAGADTRIAGQPDLAIADDIRAINDYAGTTSARMEVLRAAYSGGALADLRKMPELWPLARDAMREQLVADGVPAFVRRELIRALSVDQSPWAAEILREVWMTSPDLFPAAAVVAMAERGFFEFEREIEAWPRFLGAEDENDVPLEELLPVALYLAQRGDDRGATHLWLALTAPRFNPMANEPAFAAAGLGLLGQDSVWDETIGRAVKTARNLLESEMVEQAASLTDTLIYASAIRHERGIEFEGAGVTWPAPLHVGFVDHWVAAYSSWKNEKGRNIDDIEADLDRLETGY